jgi:predicted transcriptional regulator
MTYQRRFGKLQVVVDLDEKEHDGLQSIAEARGTSRTSVARDAIRHYCATNATLASWRSDAAKMRRAIEQGHVAKPVPGGHRSRGFNLIRKR